MTQCECSRPKRPRAPCCDECKRIDNERYAAERSVNVATSVRRLLRHHYPDWVDGAEIRDAIDEYASDALWNLHESGEVEKRHIEGFGMVYRLKQRRAA